LEPFVVSIHPGQLSFLLRAFSDTLLTEVNLRRWKTHCSARCVLCNSIRPTTAHVLSGCPVALTQNRYTYRHNMALQCLVHQFIDIYKHLPSIKVFADLPNLQASVSPLATLPPEVMLTSYRPDLVFHNTATKSIALLELILLWIPCTILEYQQLLADLDRLNITNYYETHEISFLGHHHPFCVQIY